MEEEVLEQESQEEAFIEGHGKLEGCPGQHNLTSLQQNPSFLLLCGEHPNACQGSRSGKKLRSLESLAQAR